MYSACMFVAQSARPGTARKSKESLGIGFQTCMSCPGVLQVCGGADALLKTRWHVDVPFRYSPHPCVAYVYMMKTGEGAKSAR